MLAVTKLGQRHQTYSREPDLEVTTKPVSIGLGDGFTRIKDDWDGEFLNFETW